jgi:hypothetical protein
MRRRDTRAWDIKAGRSRFEYIPGGRLPRTGDATSGGHGNRNDGRIPLEGRVCRYDALRRNADTLWSVLIPVTATYTPDLPSDAFQEPKSGHPMFRSCPYHFGLCEEYLSKRFKANYYLRTSSSILLPYGIVLCFVRSRSGVV